MSGRPDLVDEQAVLADATSLHAFAATVRGRWRLLVFGPLAAGVLAVGATFMMDPIFTALTTFMPPQAAASSVGAAALTALGPLAGLAGGAGVRNSGDQYVALMRSVTVTDRLVEQFKLMDVYGTKFHQDARTDLAANVRIALGKKDGLISVEVDDKSPQRAANIANRYVEELRLLSGVLAVTEAQQRRVFFEQQLQQTHDQLAKVQNALLASGYNASALKAEPKAAAESYARLKGEVAAADVRLQVARGNLADGAPEVRQLQATLNALREQLARSERANESTGGPDYIGRYRDFKYQETLVELYARQFELARVDESREGALIQVVDTATPPERKSRPKRAFTMVVSALIVALALSAFVLMPLVVNRGRAR